MLSSTSTFVTYMYNVSSAMATPAGIYRDPVYKPSDLITLSDVVNGRVVMDTYSMDDFNETMVPISLSLSIHMVFNY